MRASHPHNEAPSEPEDAEQSSKNSITGQTRAVLRSLAAIPGSIDSFQETP
jgi:hypothetical protein